MKIIINESQLRLIVENEEKKDNLINFTPFYKGGIPPVEWDKMFLHLNKKKGGKYDGYYIDGNVNLHESDVTELKYLVKVEGSLNLYNSQIKSLPMLEYVGDWLDLDDSQVKSLPMLEYVGGSLFLNRTPLSDATTEEELRKQINVEVNIYL
jgi:hypothetical protein